MKSVMKAAIREACCNTLSANGALCIAEQIKGMKKAEIYMKKGMDGK